MKSFIGRTLSFSFDELDRWLVRVRPEKPALLTFLFHGLFENPQELERELLDPQQGVTVSHFRQFVQHLLEHSYQFVSPDQIRNGLLPDRKYVMITFDDGYFNNLRALPVMREYQVPAVFFITAGHVAEGRAFWWDVLYRERRKTGAPANRITAEVESLKSLTNDAIERRLAEQFGASALRPSSDLDRPLTPNELRDFARDPLVSIGNHTRYHAILTNYAEDAAREEITSAQEILRQITGATPLSVCYPNGSYSPTVVRLAKEAGLQLGITCDPHKNVIPLDPSTDAAMCLGRFGLIGNDRVARQCEVARADFHLYPRLKRLLLNR